MEADERFTPTWVSATLLPFLETLSSSGYKFVEPFSGPADVLGGFYREQVSTLTLTLTLTLT